MSRKMLSLLVCLLVPLFMLGPAKPAAAAGPAWWNASYSDRLAINVHANDAITSGYSLDVIVNHARMVSQGVSLASGDDVRIAYWNGSSWTELDRVLAYGSSWNSATTDLIFKTQAAVSANSDDTGYYLYYGNAAAVIPPANANNVYALWDDFSSGTLDSSKWNVTGSTTPTVTQSSGALTISSNNAGANYPIYRLSSNTTFGPGYRMTTRVSLTSSLGYWNFTSYAGNNLAFRGGSFAYWNGSTWITVGSGAPCCTSFGPTTLSVRQDATGKTTMAIDGVDLAVRDTGSNSDSAGLLYQANTTTTGSTFSYSVSRMEVRKYVTTEPRVSIEGANDIAFSTSVAPVFSFTIATHSGGACNAATQSAAVTTNGSSIVLGRINSGSPAVGIQDVAVVSNARVGFVVKVTSSAPLTGGSNMIPDLTSTNSSPQVFAAGAGFGYSTTGDSRWAPDKWSGLARTDDLILAGFNPGTWNTCIAYKAQVAANTPAASYSTTLTYKAIPVF